MVFNYFVANFSVRNKSAHDRYLFNGFVMVMLCRKSYLQCRNMYVLEQ